MTEPHRPIPLLGALQDLAAAPGFDRVAFRDSLIARGNASLLTLGEADVGTSWVEVLRSGVVFGNSTWMDYVRRVEFSEDDIRAMAETFASVIQAEGWFTGGLPVTVNHASLYGDLDAETTQAYARIIQVEARPNDAGGLSLWALFRWTESGAELVTSGKFAAISAEVIPADVATSKSTGQLVGSPLLVGATLCNDPMIPGMTPPQAPAVDDEMLVAASTNGGRVASPPLPLSSEASMTDPAIAKLAALLSCSESALVETARTALAERAALAEQVNVLTAERDTLRTDRDALSERVEALAAEREEAIFLSAVEAGRIVPAERESFLLILNSRGEKEADAIFPVGRTGAGKRASHSSNAETEVQSLADAALVEARKHGRDTATDADLLAVTRRAALRELEALG